MLNLQFITHRTSRFSEIEGARLALEGGCRWIQLRMKEASPEEIEQAAEQLKPICRSYGATFIVDDQVEIAQRLQLDGVHLGRHDMPVDEARRMLGPSFIIGGTANTMDDVRRLYHAGVDYLGVGPFRYTTTKQNLSPILGLEGYASILQQMKAEGIDLPLVAIGGLTQADLPDLLRVGITGIALSGSILNAADPKVETERFLKSGLR
ncbi:MAG: thiamine phosphate synthase [Bacteroides sp.]